MNAPTSSLKQLQHNEFKPNINDLKQLFDDSKRLNVEKLQQQQHMQSQLQHQKNNYYDAKPSFLEHETFLDCKNRVDFERVKQKFDSKSQSPSNMKIPAVSNKFPNTSSCSIPSAAGKPQNSSNLLRKHPNSSNSNPQSSKAQNKTENIPVNINETIQFFDNDPRIHKNIYGGKKQNQNDLVVDGENFEGNFNIDSLDVSDNDGDVSIYYLLM